VARGRSKCAVVCAARFFKVELHLRRSLEGKVQEVTEGVLFEIVSACRNVDTFTLSHSAPVTTLDHRHQCSSNVNHQISLYHSVCLIS